MDPIDAILRDHTFNRERGRCHCGTGVRRDSEHRRHLVEVARDELIPRVESNAYSRGYEQGYEDARHV